MLAGVKDSLKETVNWCSCSYACQVCKLVVLLRDELIKETGFGAVSPKNLQIAALLENWGMYFN